MSKEKSKAIETHLPCPSCGSSDALSVYDDGHGHCFSCSKHFSKRKIDKLLDEGALTISRRSLSRGEGGSVDNKLTTTNLLSSSLSSNRLTNNNQLGNNLVTTNYTTSKQILDYRGISKETFKFYGCYFLVDGLTDKPTAVVFPYDGGKALKVRAVETKSFTSQGLMSEASLFGLDKFGSATAQAITLTEGELDALSVYQMMGSKYPALSVRSSSSAASDCKKNFKYLNSFERIYLAFDNDENGAKATREVAALFDPNKVFVVTMDRYKDANDYLTNNASAEFNKIWWNAKKYMPKGVVSGLNAFKEILDAEVSETVAEYPFPTLNQKLYGIRLGEVVLFKAPEKVGKQLSLETILPTPSGWTTIKELKVGDKLIARNGLSTEVTYVTEPEERPYFLVSFSDKTTLEAADDHRWTVRDLNGNIHVLNTKQLLEKGVVRKGSKAEWMVPVMEPAKFEAKHLPIDPFLLGVWLSDGHNYSANITLSDHKFAKMSRFVLRKKVDVRSGCSTYRFNELTHHMLSSNNLLCNKHIPNAYMRASLEQRTELFKGLCFDGWNDKEYYSSDKRLFDQVVELARSLGYTVNTRSRQGKYKDSNGNMVTCKTAYSFRYRKSKWKAIRSIIPIGNKVGRCLTVADDEHLFACGDGWTMTHNTEIFRAIEYHLLKTTKHRIGIIHLEEKDRRAIEGLVTYEAGRPAHLPDSGLSVEDKMKALSSLDPNGDRIHIYSHFGSENPDSILEMIRYLVAVCDCKFIFLDHITMLVTGFEGDDERKKLDYISTRLAMLAVELNFCLFLISHVNDDGKTRGSRNISKVANAIIKLERDITAIDDDERNTTHITLEGNRFSGLSGPSGALKFDVESYKLAEVGEQVESSNKKQATPIGNNAQRLADQIRVAPFKE